MNRSRGLGGFVFIFGDDSLGSVFTMYVLIKRDWFRNTNVSFLEVKGYTYSVVNLLSPGISRCYTCPISSSLIFTGGLTRSWA